ncbi:MAG: M28 family peptidase [Vicinamibacterales bacterium]
MTSRHRRVLFVVLSVAVSGAAIWTTGIATGQVGRNQPSKRQPYTWPRGSSEPRAHGFPLDDTTFVRFPLPAAEKAYADIDGERIKGYLKEVVAISLKSKADGNKWWGRIAGTEYDHMSEKWVEDRFRQLGLQDIRYQPFDLPPQWFTTSWSLSVTGGGKTITPASVMPTVGSAGTPAGGLDLEVVWVGLGAEADFMGRDVKGKAVLIESIMTPRVSDHSAIWNGAITRAEAKGAAAILVNLSYFGNWIYQAGASGVRIPHLTIGNEDGKAIREMLETGGVVRARMALATEMRPGLKDSNVWGQLPGTTDEDIIVFSHHDGYFQAASDNASGMAVMVALAEHYAKVPQTQRRRTLKFVTTSGHHAGSLGVKWMHDNRDTVLAKTALMINAEHASPLALSIWEGEMRPTTATQPRRWFVHGSPKLAALSLNAYKTFGVSIMHRMEPAASGDMGQVWRDAPSIMSIVSSDFYHSDRDTPEVIPAASLEQLTRAYAKIIDETNKLDLKDIVAAPLPSTARAGQ